MSSRLLRLTGRISVLILFLSLMTLSSCRNDADFEVTPELLEGEWQIIEAYRENKKTKLLDNGEFEFSSLQYFQTNILQDSNRYKYVLNEKIIFVEDSSRSRYNVIGLSQDTLTLNSTIHDFDFRFVLKKAVNDEK